MNKVASMTLLFLIPFVLFGNTGLAYAQPLVDIEMEILDHTNDTATVKLSWNADQAVTKYEIGCVSCSPNISKHTTGNDFTLSNITVFPNTSFAMLYILAFDSENELINAKQIILYLG